MNYFRLHNSVGLLALSSLVACQTGAPGNTTNGDSPAPQTEVPVSCGTLDPATASATTIEKLDKAFRAMFKALGPIDTSTTLARVLSLGTEKTQTPSADGLKWLDEDILPTLRDWLVAANVESAEKSEVVYLVPPELACQSRSTGLDEEVTTPSNSQTTPSKECIQHRTERPVRMAISRVACDSGDNIHGAYLFGNERKELLNFDLIGSKMTLRLDVGEMASSAERTVSGNDASWESVFDHGAKGRMEASVDVLGSDHVHLTVHISDDIEVAKSDEVDGGAPKVSSVSIAAHAQVIDVDANAGTKTLEGSLSSGAVRCQLLFSDFVQAFNRKVAASASPSETVQWNIPAISGHLSYRGEDDTVRVTGLGIGDVASQVLHGGDSILSWEVNPQAGRRVDFVATGKSDGKLILVLPGGFDLRIRYGLEPVKSLVTEPWPFSLDDDVRFALTGGDSSSVVLLPGRGEDLNLVGDLEGSLLEVTSGTFEASSRVAPDELVSVPSRQCLNRHESSGNHDLLQHLSSGACDVVSDAF